MQPNRCSFIQFCFLYFVAWPAFADLNESEEFNQKPYRQKSLAPISVIAKPDKLPFRIDINTKKTAQPLPASDGSDYLQTINGFSAVRSGNTNSDPVFRGMSGSRINTLMNGTSILGACGGRMDASTSYISPTSFDKLTVIKGPQTVLYGPSASAATILFERITPRFTENGIRFSGELLGGSDSRNQQQGDMTVGTPYTFLRLIAGRGNAGNYRDGHGKSIPSQWNKWQGDFILGITPNADTRIELSAGVSDGQSRYAGRFKDGSEFLRHSYSLKFEKTNISKIVNQIDAQIFHNDVSHAMDNYSLRDLHQNQKESLSKVSRHTQGARFSIDWNIANDATITTGIDWQQNDRRNRIQTQVGKTVIKSWVKNLDMSNIGLFGELSKALSASDKVVAGARIDWFNARRIYPAKSDISRRDVLPSGFIRLEKEWLNRTSNYYIGLGHAARAPDSWELTAPNQGQNGQSSVFSELVSERTTQIDIGANAEFNAASFWFSGYLGYINNLIQFRKLTNGNIKADQIKAHIAGGEIGASYKFNHYLSTDLALAYAWGRNANNHRPLAQVPPLDGRWQIKYEKENWFASTLWRAVAAQRRVDVGAGYVMGYDLKPSHAFNVLSLSFGYKLNKKVWLTVGVDNLFNQFYVEHLTRAAVGSPDYLANEQFASPGRFLWLKLAVGTF